MGKIAQILGIGITLKNQLKLGGFSVRVIIKISLMEREG
jgi:hypothetical protein